MRKMKALMFLRIWKMLTSLTRKLLAEHQRKKETVQATISGLLAYSLTFTNSLISVIADQLSCSQLVPITFTTASC